MLVVDVTKGMQTQTAECLVIGEISCNNMVVVLNKVDLLPKEKKDAMIEKVNGQLPMHRIYTCIHNNAFRHKQQKYVVMTSYDYVHI